MAISKHQLALDLVEAEVSASDFKEAIAAAGRILERTGIATAEYTSAMVRVVEEFGPYIVIVDGVALAHAAPGNGVIRNGISVASLAQPVDFGLGKLVRLVFALAATDHDSHIENLGELAALLGEAETLSRLLEAKTSQEIHSLLTGTGRE